MSHVDEDSRQCKTEKMQRAKIMRLSDDVILNLLKGIYPEFELQNISTSWRYNTKEDIFIQGELGDVVIKLTK